MNMEFFKKYSKNVAERNASLIYQIREFDGELWLTYSDGLVCPCSMLNVSPVEAIKTMRDLYIKRKSE